MGRKNLPEATAGQAAVWRHLCSPVSLHCAPRRVERGEARACVLPGSALPFSVAHCAAAYSLALLSPLTSKLLSKAPAWSSLTDAVLTVSYLLPSSLPSVASTSLPGSRALKSVSA